MHTHKEVALFCIGLLLFCVVSHSQIIPNGSSVSSAQQVQNIPSAYNSTAQINWVRTWEPWKAMTDDTQVPFQSVADVKQTRAYVDGLGRAIQTVTKQISPLQKDMVAYVTLDAYGRETIKYLPYISSDTSGYFKTNPFTEQQTYYSTGSLTITNTLVNRFTIVRQYWKHRHWVGLILRWRLVTVGQAAKEE
jgi:hypothetical protein